VKKDQVNELLLQALEHEIGGVKLYETALQCAQNEDLQEEWQKYLEETRNHVQVLLDVCEKFGLDAQKDTPGRQIVRHMGQSLLTAMQMALKAGDPAAAQLVACECITLAETKDHLNWELIGKVSESMDGKKSEILEEAYDEIEEQEDEHYYHTKGWCRELWIESLGLPAVLPPPEEEKHVKTAIGAARAEQQREDML
jgi:hypothetical protein